MPPSSQQIPGKSGNSGLYIAGMVVLAALMAGLLYWKMRPEPAAPTPAPTAAVPVASKPADPPPLFAPPPPPPVDEVEDAGADAGKVASGQSPAATGKSPCSGKCGDGASSPALDSAVLGLARSAQGCYNRALRTSEVSGKLTVSVQVASTGAVCSASILNDTVGSGEIASCVLGRFRGKSLPPPQSGCVVVNVPINFTIKQ
ncbi:AgmX/PglI C-terminal domain-containing protein [Sorangium sp. So ce1335]|uniref:AgmX/PglI C-terminal domain-containing protein n=1 Tax=Sorangium sp. So ce1335 TaxID=3133335 RepID=UPI003F5DDF7F